MVEWWCVRVVMVDSQGNLQMMQPAKKIQFLCSRSRGSVSLHFNPISFYFLMLYATCFDFIFFF